MWTLFQSLIVIAVMFSSIHWQWTPNNYLAGLIAVGTAAGATVLISRLIDLHRHGRQRSQATE